MTSFQRRMVADWLDANGHCHFRMTDIQEGLGEVRNGAIPLLRTIVFPALPPDYPSTTITQVIMYDPEEPWQRSFECNISPIYLSGGDVLSFRPSELFIHL